MTITLAAGRPTLADRVFSRSLVTDIVLVAAGAALTALMAQITIPLPYVPLTLQTFAVLLTGATLGASRGAISLSLYALLGFVGLPVFAPQADGSHLTGPTVLFGGTGGYIIGFIFAAALVGWLAQRQWDHKVLGTILSFVLGDLVIYAIGLPWLYTVLSSAGTPDALGITIQYGFLTFLIGDGIKALAAGGLLPLSWKLIARADAAKTQK